MLKRLFLLKNFFLSVVKDNNDLRVTDKGLFCLRERSNENVFDGLTINFRVDTKLRLHVELENLNLVFMLQDSHYFLVGDILEDAQKNLF